MTEDKSKEVGINRFRTKTRQAISLSQETLVHFGRLSPNQAFPLVMEPTIEGLNLVEWTGKMRELICEQLLQYGGILFRNFNVSSISRFELFARALSPDLLSYHERAAPRIEVGNKIYTSTEYPADQFIPLHHEMSYSHNWPTKIWFYCDNPAEQGGATPIADDREIIKRIDPKIKEKFIHKNVMYVRNYGEGVDLSWQDVFQTTDKAKVEEYCRRHHTEFEWKSGNRLKTRQVRQAVVTHPKTGDTVWFNHAHMFHISNVEPATREALLAEFDLDDLPRNAFYGDGSAIETSVLDVIRGIYQESAIRFTWQKGDILLLDNFLASHGRDPYVGPRKIVVAMAELFSNEVVYNTR